MSSRVLVVDDEPQILRFLQPALEASGYAVLHADAGREAMRAVANAAPDIVILDLGLPDMDGKEVLKQIRRFSQVPVIVLSARDAESDKIEALDAGADDYVDRFRSGRGRADRSAHSGGNHARSSATRQPTRGAAQADFAIP